MAHTTAPRGRSTHHTARTGVSETLGTVHLHADASQYDFHLTLSRNYLCADFRRALARAASLGLTLAPEADEEQELVGDAVRVPLIPIVDFPEDAPSCRH
ncbi:hypothetical protein [Streptomyces sp. NPDC006134]|uniref:hypothetical protein n=1 Tax=Streptomyces sp. NPDC006134 TaxID=3154467 RepID=UPI0033C077F0